MNISITLKKRHFYGFLVGLMVVLGAFLVTAFGGNNPAVLGHSAGELIVNSTSIVDGSIVNADVNGAAAIDGSKVNAASLSGTAAGLNIGGSAASATSATFANNANTANTANTANSCDNAVTCSTNRVEATAGDIASGTSSSPSAQVSITTNGGTDPRLLLTKAGVNGAVSFNGVNLVTTSLNVGGGGNLVVRCTVAGALPVGALTVVPADCGAAASTSLFV